MPATRTQASSNAASMLGDNLAKLGRRVVRLYDMWPNNDLINLGKEMQAMSDDVLLTFREKANERKLRMRDLVEKISEWEPTLFERLNRPSTHAGVAARDAKHHLNIGHSNGRSEDARKIREALPRWEEFNPPLGDRSTRGVKHRQCAMLLGPPTLDWEDEEAVTQFLGFGIPAMKASAWPALLWADGKFDPVRPATGLLEHEFLFRAGKAILLSPSASMPSTVQTSGARGQKRRGPIGLAKTYQLTEVTPGFIAYVACITRHALTSEDLFTESCAGFSYVDFYNEIREFLEDPKFAHWTRGLMDRWNKNIFSGIQLCTTSGTSSAPTGGTLAQLTAQLEAEEIGQQEVGIGAQGATNAADTE
ncbi:hypothetical protein FRC06_001568 [Ceratobasidium sp. 370]|nr:hypothetical protein FRC06_001568 [Ceratobasidium sp. 370]